MPFVIIQYKQKMIQSTLMPFLKKRVQNRWTQDEFSRLIKTIQEIEPVDTRGWQKVTEKMHELGPSRQTKSYKQKFNNYLDKKESLQARKVPFINKNILKYFNEGRSPQEISSLIKISIFLVKKLLKAILTKIQKYISRIIGQSMEKKISFNDFHFFAYVLSQNLELTSLTKVQNLCEHWKALKDSKIDYKTNNPKLYEKTLEYIKRKLIQFNSSLNLYMTYFQDHLAKNLDLQKETKKKYQKDSENYYSQLFLSSSHLLKKVEISEGESQMSIQAKCVAAGLQLGKLQHFKLDQMSTCVSISKQKRQNISDEYKLSDFTVQKLPIENFLPTYDDLSLYIADYSQLETFQRHFSFDFRVDKNECFFSGEDNFFEDKQNDFLF